MNELGRHLNPSNAWGIAQGASLTSLSFTMIQEEIHPGEC